MNIMSSRRFRLFAALPYRMILGITGVNLIALGRNLRGLPAYIQDWIEYRKIAPPKDSFRISLVNLYPCLGDRYDNAGTAKGDYFHQDLWIAQKVFKSNPVEHWDIGSRIDGFVAHLLTFRSVNVIDIRPLESNLPGLLFHQGDVTNLQIKDNSIDSLSCLHAMEHIGLGRYGDPIDPSGCFKGMQELQRIVAPRGRLYFSVPIGIERIAFNSHRVFDPITIVEAFSGLTLIEFAAINEMGDLINPANPDDFRSVRSACGLFVFEKTAQ